MRAPLFVALVIPLVSLVSVVTACTAKPDPKSDAKAKADNQHQIEVSTAPPVERVDPPLAEADTGEPAVANEWWCLCYQAEGEDEDLPATACRRLEAECHALELEIAAGGPGIVEESLSHVCRKLDGEHPGDAAGGRELWKPSKLAGAWTSEGACRLEGPPDRDPSRPTATDPFAIIASEGIGGLRLDMSAAEVVTVLGQPSDKGEDEDPGPNGEQSRSWTYAKQDAKLLLVDDALWMIELGPKSELKTPRGVGIGSNRAALAKAYAGMAYDEESSEAKDAGDADLFEAGSMFGLLSFALEDDAVTSISIARVAD